VLREPLVSVIDRNRIDRDHRVDGGEKAERFQFGSGPVGVVVQQIAQASECFGAVHDCTFRSAPNFANSDSCRARASSRIAEGIAGAGVSHKA
jgi:hypothetical protein